MSKGPEKRPMIHRGAALATLLLIALAVRLGSAELMLGRIREQLPDTELYQAYADSILRGGPYGVGADRAQRTPGYPAFLAAGRRMFGDGKRPLLYMQAVLGAATCLLVYGIARRLETMGMPAGSAEGALLFCAFDPYGTAMSSLLLSETLFAFLAVATASIGVSLAEHAIEKRRIGLQAGGLGLLAGAAAMVRPSALLLAPIAFVVWRILGNSSTPWLKVFLAASIGFCVLWIPWWLRNARVFGEFVPTTLNMGESLYDGWNPNATGASDTSFAQDLNVRRLTELERDRTWRERAVAFAKENPLRVLELALIKLGRFWSPWPNESRFRDWRVLVATSAYSLTVYGLALTGFVMYWRRGGLLALCLLPSAYFCAMHLIFVSSVRYRVPTTAFLSILAGAALVGLIHTVGSHRVGAAHAGRA